MDMNPYYPKAVWGFNGTERPGAVYLAAVLAGHAQKGLPAFGIYGRDVQDLNDNSIPADVAERVKKIASIKKLYAVRQLNVITKPGGIPKRVLITFSFSNQECIVEELLTELARHQYSEEYMTLTRDYYLNM